MKVTMLATAAGPNGVIRRNRVVDVPSEKAKEWIDGRYAREYDAQQDAKKGVGWEKAKDPER